MSEKKHPVKVCKKCSGFDVKELDGIVGNDHYKVDCIGVCKKKRDKKKFYGKINGEIVTCDTKEELFSQIKAAVS